MPPRTVPQVIVDTDPGIDDVLAILALAHHHRAGRLALRLVTAVGGNARLAQVAANAGYALEAGGMAEVPVRAGAGSAVGGVERARERNEVHGDDGMGGWYPAERGVGDPAGGGVEALVAALRADTEGRASWLLTLGPLTNVAQALAAEPDLPTMVDRVVVMGGAFGDPPGNITDAAEFNLWRDPAAAQRVLTAGFPLTLVPLDVTMQVQLGPTDADDLERRTGGPTLASRLLRTSITNNAHVRGLAGAPVHDALAAAVLVAPSLARTERRRLDVVVDGPAAGRVTAGGSAPPVEVVVEVDVARAKALLLDALASVP